MFGRDPGGSSRLQVAIQPRAKLTHLATWYCWSWKVCRCVHISGKDEKSQSDRGDECRKAARRNILFLAKTHRTLHDCIFFATLVYQLASDFPSYRSGNIGNYVRGLYDESMMNLVLSVDLPYEDFFSPLTHSETSANFAKHCVYNFIMTLPFTEDELNKAGLLGEGESLSLFAQLSLFTLQCINLQGQQCKGPSSPRVPSSPALSDATMVSNVSALTFTRDAAVSVHGPNKYERTSYYNGTTGGSDHPDLVYRLDFLTMPFPQAIMSF
ncbi:uncharacterized protein F5147DRAFT_647700 [Suillus discolor]|uniref:Uncharacterized protein n=1 Tax=Suillus discolor TaxID=1912936 RepID=A0A9P7K0K3_9AGAM|nr:uncharacterized protein F5147DRAFT_647700 [Suillus discolor]KAG2119825.1 hypothetical protein F5147DRAFT_647700 [Suillus discolor]